MKLLIAISDSESNILAGHSGNAWGFKLKPDRNGNKKEFLLSEDHRKYSIPGNFITFWSSEKDTSSSQGFVGLGIIMDNQIPGKIDRNIWMDNNYYGELPFKSLSLKKMPLDVVKTTYGNSWNRLFTVISPHLPAAKINTEQLKKFILYMLHN